MGSGCRWVVVPPLSRCKLAKVSLRKHPDHGAEQVSELLYGEAFEVAESADHWAHVRLIRDDYGGWIPNAALLSGQIAMPHAVLHSTEYRISQLSGLIFARPDIKSPLLHRFYLGSPVDVIEADSDFYELDSGGFVHKRHVAVQAQSDLNPLEVAFKFIGTPYLWGGRTCDGMDCSGLVQTALHACGLDCPRDTGDQRTAFATSAVAGPPMRGDLIYFPGHVGIMVDAVQMIHANAFWMSTVIEPLAVVAGRFPAETGNPISAIIRLT